MVDKSYGTEAKYYEEREFTRQQIIVSLNEAISEVKAAMSEIYYNQAGVAYARLERAVGLLEGAVEDMK